MLDFSQMRHRGSVSRKTAPGTQILAEGLALVADPNVDQGVAVASGTAGEQFVGISITTQVDPTSIPNYEALVVTQAGGVQIEQVAIGDELFVKNVTTGVTLEAAASGTAQSSLTAAQYALAATGSRDIVVPAAMAGDELLVGYRFAATVAAARWLQGDALPGQNVSTELSTVGVITSGDVFTSEFDVTADWFGSSYVGLSANGQFTVAATAADAIPGVRLLSRPSQGSAWLGLSIGFNG